MTALSFLFNAEDVLDKTSEQNKVLLSTYLFYGFQSPALLLIQLKEYFIVSFNLPIFAFLVGVHISKYIDTTSCGAKVYPACHTKATNNS